MKLKSVCAVLLALLLMLGGCARSNSEESVEAAAPIKGSDVPNEMKTTENTESSQKETKENTPPTEPVVDAYNGSWVAPTGEMYTYIIPRLQLPGDEAEKINSEIYGLYSGNLNENGELWGYMEYSYEIYSWKGLLTLILRIDYPGEYSVDDFAIASQHYVYTLRLSDGSRVAPQEVLELSGVAQEEFYSKVSEILGNAYCLGIPEDYFQTILSTEPLSRDEALLTQFAGTVSEENASACLPYLNEAGELCFRGKVYQVAGASYHTQLFSFAPESEFFPYYETLLGLTAEE